MRHGLTRRSVLAGALLTPLLRALRLDTPAKAATMAALEFGPTRSFSFARLREQARQRALRPYQAPLVRHAEVLEGIDYDAHRQIRYRPEAALWREGDGPSVHFFFLANLFREPVTLYAVRAGVAREILYSPALFAFGDARHAAELPADLGFAGFRVLESRGRRQEWLAFLGAAYFRSPGELDQYGLSARGIAIDTGLPTPEEFPRFTHFWLEPAPGPESLVIYALLDGPSITGAYRFEASRQTGVTMDVTAVLFARRTIGRLGVAPLTSMYWFSETRPAQGHDWRPEVHDSDGLALWTGQGERLWRPLNNPTQVQTNSFLDVNPRGFGLLQRDHDFEHYQDDNVFYERRPSLWVEPLEEWGEGAVQLVEIPTNSEFTDNIVAYWLPREPVAAGSSWTFTYRLHWLADEPYPASVSRVVATRLKWNEILSQRQTLQRVKLVIDFAGNPLDRLDKYTPVELVVSASHGSIVSHTATPLLETGRWRGVFELDLADREPVDLRAYLDVNGRALTETWLYQIIPPSGSF